MKQYATRFLKTVALIYLAFPATYLLVAAVLFDIPANQCGRILLSPSYYLLSAVAMVAGYGLWEMRFWAWYFFVASNLLITYTNAVWAADFGEAHHKAIAYVVFTLALVLLMFRVAREIRVPYFLPKIRWWESNPRYRLSVPVRMLRPQVPDETASFDGEILDLSMGGCFIKCRYDFVQDEPVRVTFLIFGQPIECSGSIVWRTRSTVTHPQGIGIKFSTMPRPERRILRAATARLKKISTLYRSSRYLMSQEDFSRRMEELTTGKLEWSRRLVGRRRRASGD